MKKSTSKNNPIVAAIGKDNFSWIVFIILLILGILPGLVYLFVKADLL